MATDWGTMVKANAGKDCRKAKAVAGSAKAAVCGKSERCQERRCVGGDCEKRMLPKVAVCAMKTATSSRVLGDCEKANVAKGDCV